MRISDWSSDVCSSDLYAVSRRFHWRVPGREPRADVHAAAPEAAQVLRPRHRGRHCAAGSDPGRHGASLRSEEHTSELQSLMRISYAVFCLKKKHKTDTKMR